MFSSLIYSCEAWGDITAIADSLAKIERKALKCCLGVKDGTSNDIVYIELNKPDIISAIYRGNTTFSENS